MADDTTNTCPMCNAHAQAMARLAEMEYLLCASRPGQWQVWNGLDLPGHLKIWSGPTPEAAINAAWAAWKEREG